MLLVTIYCFGLSFSIPKTPFSYNQSIETDTTHEKAFTSASNTLCFHTPVSETTFSGITENLSFKLNQDFESFWAVILPNEWRLYANFKQYQTYFKNILLRYRKTDLIFPFHNFW
ncbi:hypothetical protein [Pseudotamlana agarivorans]|uniref:hypothetical protein n=1 Tax=Pseudotamlana agarivorans TaxID=481183 RepID=UPI00082CA0A2|nr:hypothetical protein [Tamlana agarivorans]